MKVVILSLMAFISRALTRHISILVSDLRVSPFVDPYLVTKVEKNNIYQILIKLKKLLLELIKFNIA